MQGANPCPHRFLKDTERINMESLHTIYELRSGNRLLTIAKSKDSVDIRITKFTRSESIEAINEEEDLNIPISMDTYNALVSEMIKGC